MEAEINKRIENINFITPECHTKHNILPNNN